MPPGAVPPPAGRPISFQRGSHVELARALLIRLETRVEGKIQAPVYDEGCLHRYDQTRGIWARVSETEAGRIVQSFDGFSAGKGFIKLKESDVKGAQSCARREVTQEGFFTRAGNSLVFKDTAVSVGGDGAVEKAPHGPGTRARFAYDFEWTDEEPARFIQALADMFQDDPDREEKILLVGEFAGACLLGAATKFQRWVLLKGGGDDGKSTLIDMIRAAMPAESTCSIKPEDLEDEYSRADLAGKLLNTVTEVKQRDVLEAETLKAVTAGDQMRGRRIRESPIDFKPIAGQLFAANGYPKFSDSSHGFWRRPIVVLFNHKFTNDPKRNVNLSDEILAAERAQIVCWFVRRGAEAIKRGKYLEPKSHFEAIKEWRGETDAVYEFVDECLIISRTKPATRLNGWSEPSNLYERFLEWAKKTGHREMSSTAFGRRLTELGYNEERNHGLRFRPLRPRRPGESKKADGTLADN
jgi:P4 family phage/plasmid primase-like protien